MKKGMLFFAGVFFALQVAAQFPYTRPLEIRTGQQRPEITCLSQDRFGQIWAGSDLGLLRTDGEDVQVVVRSENASVLAVTHANGKVYAAFSSGAIIRCASLGCDTIRYDKKLVQTPVRKILVDKNGVVYLATYGGGIHVLGSNGISRITTKEGLPDDHVNDLALLSTGSVVAATDQGLAICDTVKVLRIYGEQEGAPDNLTLSVAVGEDGSIWAGTDRRGAFRINAHALEIEPLVLDPEWNDGPVISIAVSNELIWLATRTKGIVLVDRGAKGGKYLQPRASDIPSMAAKQLVLTDDGAALWCNGTEKLLRADPAILFVPEHEGIDLRHITAICTGPNDEIWFATDDGLFNHPAAFGEHSFITKIDIDLPAQRTIVSLAVGNDGVVWAATFGSGVYAISPTGVIKHFGEHNGLPNDNVLAVRSGFGTVWCATLDGLAAYDERTGKWKNHANSGPGFVYDVVPRPQGAALAATDGNGVVQLDSMGKLITFKNGGSRTYYMMAMQGEDVWAAGPGTGLCKVGKDTMLCDGKDRVPFGDELFALGSSGNRLVAFGAKGVTAFSPATGSWANISARVGLDEVSAELNVLCTEKDGTLWLGCDKGLVRMRSSATDHEPNMLPFITGVTVGNVPVPLDTIIHVPSDRNTFTVHFTASALADPGAIRFSYHLLGHAQSQQTTRDREVTFNDLPAGDHTFELRAFSTDVADDNAADNGLVAKLHVVVERVWWKRTGTLVLFFGSLIILAFFLIRTRELRLRDRLALEKEKVRFQLDAVRSQVNPHFLFNSFNALVVLIESDTDKAVEHVGQLSTFFRNILQVRDKDLITVKEEIVLLLTYFALEKRRFGAAIELNVEEKVTELQALIVPLTLQILVENALKHNRIDKDRTLTISIRSGSNELIVENPIFARRSPAQSTGFGLESITKRYAAFTTRPVQVEQSSTEFVVRIPLIDPDQ